MTARTDTLTWRAMVRIEPELANIEADALATPHSWEAYERLKRRVSRLVGWDAGDDRLAGSEAYMIATDRIVAALERTR